MHFPRAMLSGRPPPPPKKPPKKTNRVDAGTPTAGLAIGIPQTSKALVLATATCQHARQMKTGRSGLTLPRGENQIRARERGGVGDRRDWGSGRRGESGMGREGPGAEEQEKGAEEGGVMTGWARRMGH